MKRLISLMFILIIVVSSCSKTEDDKIVVWAIGNEGELLRDFVLDFTEETGIEVELVTLPWNEVNEKLNTAIAGQTTPDITMIGNTWTTQYAETGALADLTEYIDEYSNLDHSFYTEAAIETGMYQDKQYSIPWQTETRVLYYRTDIIPEICGDVPSTQDELYQCSYALSQRSDEDNGFRFDIDEQLNIPILAWGNGWDFMDENGEWRFDEQEYIDALTYAANMKEDGIIDPTNGLEETQTFLEGTEPLIIGGPAFAVDLNAYDASMSDKWSIATIPAGSNEGYSNQGGSNFAMFEASENKEDSLEFLNWLVSEEQSLRWNEVSGFYGARNDIWDNEQLQSEIDQVFFEQLQLSVAPPQTDVYATMMVNVRTAMQEVLLNDRDPEEAALELQEKNEALIGD